MTNSKIQLDSVFQDVLHKLAHQSNMFGRALRGKDRRRWEVFNFTLSSPEASPEYDKSYELGNYEDVHALFKRDSLSDTYIQAHTNKTNSNGPWSIADAMRAKIQADFLSGCERDFRARHMTRVRLLAHEASRQDLYTDTEGPLLDDTVEWIASKGSKRPLYKETEV